MKTEAQTSLRMPEELRDRLAQAAAGNGRSLGEEIRRRLEASFGSAAPQADDPQTAQLLRIIARAAAILSKEWAAWHEDLRALAVFRAAIAALFSPHKPPAAAAMPYEAAVLFEGSPENAGKRLAFMATLAELPK